MKRIVVATASLLALLVLLLLTDPTKLPSLALIAPYVLLFIVFIEISTLLVSGKKIRNFRLRVVYAALPTSLLVLQSIDQLTIRDFITVLAIFFVTYFYVLNSTEPTP